MPRRYWCMSIPAGRKRNKHNRKRKSPSGHSAGASDCRKTYITKRVVRPTPINPQKAATCAWLFALLKGQVCAKGVHTAPCKNSKKWPKPLFRHAQVSDKTLTYFLTHGSLYSVCFAGRLHGWPPGCPAPAESPALPAPRCPHTRRRGEYTGKSPTG